MKRISIFATAMMCLFGILGSISEASILGQKLSFNGVIDEIDDNSRAVIFDNDSDDILSTGDDIVGLIRFDGFGPVGSTTNVNADELIFAIFSVRVGTSFSAFGSSGFNHTPVPLASSNSLKSLLADDLEPGGFVFSGDEFFAIVEQKSAVPGDNPFNSDTSPVTEITTEITAAKGWALDAIGNLTGDDFFQTLFATGASVAPLDTGGAFGVGAPDGTINISEIRADSSGATVLTERAAFSIEFDIFGASLKPISAAPFDAPLSPAFGDVVLKPDGSVQTTSLANSDVVDDSNFQINPTPEPVSLIVWSGLALICAGGIRRRRGQLRG